MNVLSLFAGIGGIDLAASWAGMQTIAFCEIDKFCQQVLNKHWPDVPIYGDVRTITKKQLEKDGVINETRAIDLVCGGFPCQPFSVAGKQRGEEDDRHLWPEMLRVIKEFRPTWVIGENVVGIVKLALDDVISDLESEGYTARAFVLPASAVEAPHQRQRVFIVAHSSSERWDHGGDNRKERQIHSNQKWDTSKNQREGNGRFSRIGANGQTVANSNSAGQQKRNVTTITTRQGFDTRGASKSKKPRTVKSRVGGIPPRLPAGMDQHKWPALLGQAQHAWEQPRVATGVKHRKERLQALGNAVVPQQIYPILKAIMDIEKGEGEK